MFFWAFLLKFNSFLSFHESQPQWTFADPGLRYLRIISGQRDTLSVWHNVTYSRLKQVGADGRITLRYLVTQRRQLCFLSTTCRFNLFVLKGVIVLIITVIIVVVDCVDKIRVIDCFMIQ